MLAPPPGELAPPPRGNPGSATEHYQDISTVHNCTFYIHIVILLTLSCGHYSTELIDCKVEKYAANY